MGAPGSSYWTGSLFVYNITTNKYKAFLDRYNQVKFGSYLGYSVGAGHFRSMYTTEVVGGAPQHEQIGKAYIFSIDAKELNILHEMKGKKVICLYLWLSLRALVSNSAFFSMTGSGLPWSSLGLILELLSVPWTSMQMAFQTYWWAPPCRAPSERKEECLCTSTLAW
uniref:Integrin subunit alpha 4 n=1 Tax=Sus scrofa TaxID=9823 RepID=A0A8D1GQJ2_PIG